MKRALQTLINLIYSDRALYCYLGLSLISVLSLSIYQIQKDYVSVPDGVQDEFRPYVRNFLRESRKHVLPIEFEERVQHLTIKFGFPSRLNDEHDFVGWCELNTTTIIVEKDTWNTYKEGSRQSLIDHELGHCLLERNHRPYLAEGNHPVSIMYPKVLPSDYYDKHKGRLYSELFEYNRSNKIRLEVQVLNMTWNEEMQARFVSIPEFLRFIESEINGDPYQPWEPSLQKAQVIQFDTAEIISVPSGKSTRQEK
jgi:hypothetical protein